MSRNRADVHISPFGQADDIMGHVSPRRQIGGSRTGRGPALVAERDPIVSHPAAPVKITYTHAAAHRRGAGSPALGGVLASGLRGQR
ncbi:MAG TPA: hypothetical protein DHU96_27100 [Actinobacteria bacterium]|nr:hypothetical protein [Actinomycetota bacterium]